MATLSSLQSLQNILHLVRVVDAGSFSEAARRSGTTTSALSKAVTRLEQAHGVKLLHRSTHAISMTPDGEKLIEGARHLLLEAEQLQGLLDQTGGGGAAGRVRLSAPGPFIRTCLSSQLPALLRAHPKIELDLRVDDAQLELAAEGVDIAIRIGTLDGQPGLVTRRLGSFPWLLCASPRYLEAMGGLSSPEALRDHHQIGFRDAGSGQLMPWQFTDPKNGGTIRHVPRNRLVVEDMTTIWAMVAGVHRLDHRDVVLIERGAARARMQPTPVLQHHGAVADCVGFGEVERLEGRRALDRCQIVRHRRLALDADGAVHAERELEDGVIVEHVGVLGSTGRQPVTQCRARHLGDGLDHGKAHRPIPLRPRRRRCGIRGTPPGPRAREFPAARRPPNALQPPPRSS